MSRSITPVQFARALQSAQGYRMSGESSIVSAHLACDTIGISRDWTIPLIATLNDSPAIAEAWADRRVNEALDRAYARAEQEQSHGQG